MSSRYLSDKCAVSSRYLSDKCALCGHPAVQHQLLVRTTSGKTISSLEAISEDFAALESLIRGACRGGGEPEGYADCPKGCTAFVAEVAR